VQMRRLLRGSLPVWELRPGLPKWTIPACSVKLLRHEGRCRQKFLTAKSSQPPPSRDCNSAGEDRLDESLSESKFVWNVEF
jgi:hypothetical protein